jgi:uncharacterized radical SAM protein YgiQ
MTKEEMLARGWDWVDVVFVTGDAYIDHPSFAMAILGRVLEKHGFRVAILSQPDWRSCEPWRQFGRPRLFFGVSAGNMDSLINHYTANKKVRNDDAYSPGGRIGLRPDRATLPYCQRAREAFPGVPVIAGGVEASLRRLAHYDYWSDTVKKSILLDAKPDVVCYGMGEKVIVDIASMLRSGATAKDLRKLRGVAYVLGASEVAECETGFESPEAATTMDLVNPLEPLSAAWPDPVGQGLAELPSFERVAGDKHDFVEATRLIHLNTNPFNAKTLVQRHDRRAVVVNPPALPLAKSEMDNIYDLPYTRQPHPTYKEKIPAYEMIKDSVTIMRGCFGGCTFCSITAHQGRIIQSRSKASILRELNAMTAQPQFKGVVSDIGGPTANMYEMRCTQPEVEKKCKRLSCVHPTICKLLGTDHGPLIDLMRSARAVKGIRKVFVASGVRMDLAQNSPEYLQELAAHHVGGHLKVAPEHTDAEVLKRMKKPVIGNFENFATAFQQASTQAGKPKQFLVPYFIASHPGSDLGAMIELALFLKRNGYRPDQVQDFIPAPFDIATCMYYTGIDPMTREAVHVDKHLRNRKLQRALMQFFKPENYFLVREALEQAGRPDLIGKGCDALIPEEPPAAALLARRSRSQSDARDFVHRIPTAPKSAGSKSTGPKAAGSQSVGYRPGRATAPRRDRFASMAPPDPKSPHQP